MTNYFKTKVYVNHNEYLFVTTTLRNKNPEDSYFDLAYAVFGLIFMPWYRCGYCDDSFITYTLYDGSDAVSSVGVVVNNFMWNGKARKYAQISTVMTESDYRNRGLSKWLMDTVLDEWKNKCDSIYLYANDSVVDFYPKFGFVTADEYRYSLPVIKKKGLSRKLSMSSRDDVDLLIRKHKESNPFSVLKMDKSVSMMMFHCITFLHEYIYYVEEYDAVVIAEQDGCDMFCYDVYCRKISTLRDILGAVTISATCNATLGFTPSASIKCSVCKADEEDTTIFVMDGMENIFAGNKVTLPFLSRA